MKKMSSERLHMPVRKFSIKVKGFDLPPEVVEVLRAQPLIRHTQRVPVKLLRERELLLTERAEEPRYGVIDLW